MDPITASRFGIDAAAADTLFREAHTAYAFTDEPVSDEQLEEIYELVRHAPTAMNSQPLRVVFVRTPEAKAGSSRCWRRGIVPSPSPHPWWRSSLRTPTSTNDCPSCCR